MQIIQGWMRYGDAAMTAHKLGIRRARVDQALAHVKKVVGADTVWEMVGRCIALYGDVDLGGWIPEDSPIGRAIEMREHEVHTKLRKAVEMLRESSGSMVALLGELQ